MLADHHESGGMRAVRTGHGRNSTAGKENRKEGIQMKPGYEQIRNDREINLLIEQETVT